MRTKRRKILWGRVVLALSLTLTLCAVATMQFMSSTPQPRMLTSRTASPAREMIVESTRDKEVVDEEEYVEECVEHEEAEQVAITMPEVPHVIERASHIQEYYYNVPLSKEVQDYMKLECVKAGVEPALILAMIEVESNFNPNIVSETADWGLMQINEINHPYFTSNFGITDFLNEENSIFCGVHLISRLVHEYDTLHMALMAYNMGESGASTLWAQGVFSSPYSEKIVAAMAKYK